MFVATGLMLHATASCTSEDIAALCPPRRCCCGKGLLSPTNDCPAQRLFLVGGVQMIVAEVVVAALLGHYFTAAADWVVPNDVGLAVLIIICLFVSGFAYRCRSPPCLQCFVHCRLCTAHLHVYSQQRNGSLGR